MRQIDLLALQLESQHQEIVSSPSGTWKCKLWKQLMCRQRGNKQIFRWKARDCPILKILFHPNFENLYSLRVLCELKNLWKIKRSARASWNTSVRLSVCLLNHQKTHQTSLLTPWDPAGLHLDSTGASMHIAYPYSPGTLLAYPLTPLDPVGLPLDPLGLSRPTPWPSRTL